MNGPAMGRRALLLAVLAALGACAAPEPPPPVVVNADPDPEQVYRPGAISWFDLTDEHKRRARQALTRIGEAVPDDDTLQARWLTMSPAQQRFLIRRPPPPAPPARHTTARGRTPARGSQQHRPASRSSAHPAPAHPQSRPASQPQRTTRPPQRRPQQQ